MATTNNIHAHHRERLRNRFVTYGYESFEPHNILELLLFYGIPYKDTNPIAHELLREFGSITDVLQAPPERLCEISGVGKHVTELLYCVGLASDVAVYEGLFFEKSAKCYPTANDVGRLLVEKLGERNRAGVYSVMLNNRYELLRLAPLSDADNGLYRIDRRALLNEALQTGAAVVILARYKTDGIAVPYSEDMFTFNDIKNELAASGISVSEFFVVTENDYSIASSVTRKGAKDNATKEATKFAANDGLSDDRHRDAAFDSVSSIIEMANKVRYVDRTALLESLLSFTTRKPTHEIAKKLLDDFGSFYEVLGADASALREAGISEVGCVLLRLTFILKKYIAERQLAKGIYLNERDKILTALSVMLSGENEEMLLLLVFDKAKRLCGIRRLAEGGSSSVGMAIGFATKRAVAEGADTVIIAHNHPNGVPTPSKSDVVATDKVRSSLRSAGIELYAHYVISGARYCEI